MAARSASRSSHTWSAALRIPATVGLFLCVAGLLPNIGITSGRETHTFARSSVVHLHTFIAFRQGHIAPGLRVTTRRTGSCSAPSLVTSRPYSWRCSSPHLILDPCFSPGRVGVMVVCPATPWGKAVTLLDVAPPLSHWKLAARGVNFPWGLWTANGKRCISLSGGSLGPRIKNKTVTYRCKGGGYLLGYVQRQRPEWTIYYTGRISADLRAGPIVHVRITDVWQ